MIVPMHKYTFLVHHAGFEQFIDDLKKLGVIHVIESDNEPTESMQETLRALSDVNKTIKFLNSTHKSETDGSIELPLKGEGIIALVKQQRDKLEKLQQELAMLEKEQTQLTPWGEFSWENIERLKNIDLSFHFFYCTSRKYTSQWEQSYNIDVIAEYRGFTYFVLILEKGEQLPEIDADEVGLPKASLVEVIKNIEAIKNEIIEVESSIGQIAIKGVSTLKNYLLQLKENLALESVHLHTSNEVEGAVKLLEGWVPDSNCEKVEAFLEKEGVVYLHEKGKADDKPPVLLKNNRFNKLFEVIGNLYSLPNYSELDLTPFIAPFYLLFFGFCFSDAGYGLLFVLAGTILKLKQKDPSPILSLIQLLGASTMLFGFLGGAFFGIALYETNLPFYSSIAQAYGSVEVPITKVIQDVMFKASLGLGLIQILFGMFLRTVKLTKQKGFIHAISTLSWALLIVASVINYLIAGKTDFWNTPYLVFSGLFCVGIFFINSPGKSIFINFGAGLWDAYNTVVGGIGDLLSYVRLFALGLASAILGLVFNDLGLKLVNPDAGIGMLILGYVLMILVLVVGHAINIFMSGLGSMVHPLRLTFVEFYKNAGFEGGGKAYNPFRKQTIK